MPLFHYDHIANFAEVREHDPNNLALLCPTHHHAKTTGQLSRERISRARQEPFNSGRDITTAYGIEAAREIAIRLGSNEAHYGRQTDDHSVVWINGESFLSVHREGDSYTYSVNVTDEAGSVLLAVVRGELVVSTGVWDYRYEGRTVSIRRGQGKILFEAEISDISLDVRRATFVDRYEAGLMVRPDGAIVVTIGGLQICQWENIIFGPNTFGEIAVVRDSCFDREIPTGFGYVKQMPAAFEQWAVDRRRAMERGSPGSYPPGLAKFRPFPR